MFPPYELCLEPFRAAPANPSTMGFLPADIGGGGASPPTKLVPLSLFNNVHQWSNKSRKIDKVGSKKCLH
jgi:hypothetical protein